MTTPSPRLDGPTPGPWTVDGPPYNQIVWAEEITRICFLAHSNGANDARDIANGCLIAAAPDMLKGLEQAARWFEEYAVEHYAKARTAPSYAEQGGRESNGKRNQERADYLRAAIARARGNHA